MPIFLTGSGEAGALGRVAGATTVTRTVACFWPGGRSSTDTSRTKRMPIAVAISRARRGEVSVTVAVSSTVCGMDRALTSAVSWGGVMGRPRYLMTESASRGPVRRSA